MSDEPLDPAEDGTDPEPELPPENVQLVDPVAYRKARDKRKREEQERHSFWRSVLGNAVGRKEVWRLLNEAHTFNTDFSFGPVGFPDHMATMHTMGQQQWGLRLYHDLLLIDHAAVYAMHREFDPRFDQKPPKQMTASEG